jgi:Uma2 family endonuclease
MTWTEIINDPSLHNLQYKIETNERGQIVMSPATNKHSRFQSRISSLLEELMQGGEFITECAIQTSKGVRVADVAWASTGFLEAHANEDAYSLAPEICVEVISPSNTPEEMLEKRDLYLARGAREVWTCDLEGQMKFYAHAGKLERSEMVPEFPLEIRL